MGVQKTIVTEGTGPQPNKGQVISMHYTGWVKDTSKPESRGSKYASSLHYSYPDVDDVLGLIPPSTVASHSILPSVSAVSSKAGTRLFPR